MPPPLTPLPPAAGICPLPSRHCLPMREDASSPDVVGSRCGNTSPSLPTPLTPLAPTARICSPLTAGLRGGRRGGGPAGVGGAPLGGAGASEVLSRLLLQGEARRGGRKGVRPAGGGQAALSGPNLHNTRLYPYKELSIHRGSKLRHPWIIPETNNFHTPKK
eukprot:454595-Prorocentrum_minimum.AAC.2